MLDKCKISVIIIIESGGAVSNPAAERRRRTKMKTPEIVTAIEALPEYAGKRIYRRIYGGKNLYYGCGLDAATMNDMRKYYENHIRYEVRTDKK